ncbi:MULTISPECIES: 16S rRNA (uracil(1498)-N(3))-methyltransferase [unclassified Mucilaginibacter]|uniref:16S rRNA (uracil(1498)-N(3))-methyltransferase n=1 Tax=unclassified Mucilaginibacter TaxID=2617802 RepID=UPI002AC957B2|nr:MULTISPECIES: 16S rRNA (uracil(1498)-N(3))-methyltransferase [unclassified Mucilaginibacter]MEB0262147.1 16S rRNA (uracil(1498)-N(3))-methyltransferase [Mucilaginibacter sp. 10I4]MEB0279808.1 16S rRNA (uracil(1498)-N(3))-methyltransferase [Mucilaginibacter sp. 10B2]MEB0301240.1 16S rRNA (uracil(1498)-N(3))-methyltransferase [Mucilaginibacter sp. 5C4]WPX24220.1 16S rRNA (uracil(1498)-N(3))-methyltransferase [Mucilaginibacter sp. 5C4]
MQLFYTPDIDPTLSQYFLSEEESKHAVRVLRLNIGDAVTLIDGKGGLYKAEIKDAHPKRTILQINSVTAEFNKRNHYLHIAIAPTKNLDRIEWFLEKATEIGIDEISLIICQRSERKEAKVERLDKIITSAIKQSIKAYHPILNAPVNLNQFLKQPFYGQKFIAHCDDGEKVELAQSIEKQNRYLILIGPEGDFSPSEVDAALQNGYKAITLGESRLRTETAALEACFEVNFLNR